MHEKNMIATQNLELHIVRETNPILFSAGLKNIDYVFQKNSS